MRAAEILRLQILDEDILDMVNAGLVGVTIMDDLIAAFWAKVYDGIAVHNDLSLADEDKIGWAVRKGTPSFLSLINEFVKRPQGRHVIRERTTAKIFER